MMRFAPLLLIMFISACSRLPVNSERFVTQTLHVGNGPEDMVLDTQSGEPRLLISCNSRRESEAPFGEIVSYRIATGRIDTVVRFDNLKGNFNPHGIDLALVNDSLILFVVNHKLRGQLNTIARYLVQGDSLYLIDETASPLITSPNDVCGLTDGSFIVSNDAGKHFFTTVLGIRNSEAVICKDGNCSKLDSKVCYGNGITVRKGWLYRAAVTANKIYRYRFHNGILSDEEVFAEVPGPDNFSWRGDTLVVAAHLRFLKFVSHLKDSSVHSPSTAYYLDTRLHKCESPEAVYCDTGTQIDAASTAISFGNNLFLAGVFDDELLIVTMPR